MTLSVAEATAVLREQAGDATAVVTMSALAFWGEPRPQDFRLKGTMGAAASIGLGLALGAPDRRVWVVDGDGSLLMQLGVSVAVAGAAPANFTHFVIDNGVYAVSGAQPTPAPRDWPALLLAAGYSAATACGSAADLRAAVRDRAPGPRAVVVRCARERPEYPAGFLDFSAVGEAARLRRVLAAHPSPSPGGNP